MAMRKVTRNDLMRGVKRTASRYPLTLSYLLFSSFGVLLLVFTQGAT
jgi:hypothetical protein